MGDLRPNNGGGTPPEDGGGARPGDLPELPPEWGPITIPDDASELDREAAALRRELRRQTRRHRLSSTFGLAQSGRDGPSLGVPVVIMAVAVITTLLSLFVVTWDRRPASNLPATGSPGGPATPTALVDVTLADAGGDRVRLGGLLPAVILLTDGCDCAALIAKIAAASPPPVTIVPIGRTAPCPADAAANVRCLADPEGAVTGRFPAASGSPTPQSSPATSAGGSSAAASASPSVRSVARAVLVDSTGAATQPMAVDSTDDLSAGFARLIGG